jgi:BirA family transcriptional regulator, biotin operon repressor / biotin---[acetyl-CoA-carboxylase] ligase
MASGAMASGAMKSSAMESGAGEGCAAGPDQPGWLHELETCPSTNRWALDRLSTLAHGDVVFTRRQTAGRGQRGRVWQSPPGGLTASIVLHQIPVRQWSGFSLIVGLAVIDTIAQCCPEISPGLGLKWANDVWLHDRKLAGVLCEGSASGTHGSLVIGIGLNCRVDFAAAEMATLAQRATSLHQWATVVPDDLTLLTGLRQALLAMAAQLVQSDNHLYQLLPALRQRDVLRGQWITVVTDTETISGEAVGIGDDGQLLLQLPTGAVRSLRSGHVEW